MVCLLGFEPRLRPHLGLAVYKTAVLPLHYRHKTWCQWPDSNRELPRVYGTRAHPHELHWQNRLASAYCSNGHLIQGSWTTLEPKSGRGARTRTEGFPFGEEQCSRCAYAPVYIIICRRSLPCLSRCKQKALSFSRGLANTNLVAD